MSPPEPPTPVVPRRWFEAVAKINQWGWLDLHATVRFAASHASARRPRGYGSQSVYGQASATAKPRFLFRSGTQSGRLHHVSLSKREGTGDPAPGFTARASDIPPREKE